MCVCVCVCVCVCACVLQEYPKVSQAYYGLLEVLTQDHMDFISTMEPPVFTYILSSISEGLTGLGEGGRGRGGQEKLVYTIPLSFDLRPHSVHWVL